MSANGKQTKSKQGHDGERKLASGAGRGAKSGGEPKKGSETRGESRKTTGK